LFAIQQTPQTQSVQQPTGGGFDTNALVSALVSKGYNETDAKNAASGPRSAELAKEYLGIGGTPGATGTGATMGFLNAPTINLPELYDNLFKTSGVSDMEKKLSDMTTSFNEAMSKINDNPYLSEANRVGRIQKLQTDFNNSSAGIRNDIATKKADIEMKLNLETKQFDINSQQAQTAISQFNTLLSSGALDGASGEDIANITRATGISSDMINSAINAQKAKNVQTSTMSFDDGTNQGFVVINSSTGEIINKQTISQSKPKAESVVDQRVKDEQQTQQNAIADIQAGSTLRDIVNHYAVSGGLTVEDIYRLYNSYSPYGAAKEDIEDVKAGKFKA